MEKNNKLIAYGALVLCATFWGWSFFATTVVVQIASPIEVIAIRWMIAAVIFLVLIAMGKIRIDLKRKETKLLMLTAFCQPFIYSLFETSGIKYTSTSESSIIISTIPCFTMILGVLLFTRKVSPLMPVSTARRRASTANNTALPDLQPRHFWRAPTSMYLRSAA